MLVVAHNQYHQFIIYTAIAIIGPKFTHTSSLSIDLTTGASQQDLCNPAIPRHRRHALAAAPTQLPEQLHRKINPPTCYSPILQQLSLLHGQQERIQFSELHGQLPTVYHSKQHTGVGNRKSDAPLHRGYSTCSILTSTAQFSLDRGDCDRIFEMLLRSDQAFVTVGRLLYTSRS